MAAASRAGAGISAAAEAAELVMAGAISFRLLMQGASQPPFQAAEAKTSGEIIAVVTPECSSYLYAPFMWAAIIALLVPWPLIQWTWWPSTWVYLAQLVAFVVLLTLLMPRGVRRLLVPAYVKRQMARRRARGAVHSAEPASHRQAHGCVDIRVGRRAVCGDHRRPGRA